MAISVFGLAGCITASVALVLAIVAAALNTWMTLPGGGSYGLWKQCSKVVCIDIDDIKQGFSDDTKSDLRSVRAMIILGILLLPGAIVCMVLKMFVMKDKDILTLVGGAVAGVAGLFLMIAMAVYHGQIYSDLSSAYDLGAGFALDVTAWLLAWVAAGLMIASKFLDKSS